MAGEACVKECVCMTGGLHCGGGGLHGRRGVRGRRVCMVGEMAIESAVRILLECILV